MKEELKFSEILQKSIDKHNKKMEESSIEMRKYKVCSKCFKSVCNCEVKNGI